MASIITPTLSIQANANDFETEASQGPMSMAFSLSTSCTVSTDFVKQELVTLPVDSGDGTPDCVKLIDGSDLATAAGADGASGASGFTHGSVGCYVYIKNTGNTNIAAFGIVSSARIDVDDDLTSLAYDATPLQPDDAAANGTGLSEVTGKNFRTFSLKPGEFVFMPFDYLGDLYGEGIGGATTLEMWRFDRL